MSPLANRYARSIACAKRSRLVTPGGAQTASKRPDRFPEGAFPAYLASAKGARVWDLDGNEYVDWICGLGAVPLGYDYAPVTTAIIEQLHWGIISGSLPTDLEDEVAAELVKVVPCAGSTGQVRFVKTGSEACAAAVRIARRATRREQVLVIGYHGWHDWVQAASPAHPGIPEELSELVRRIPYNDLETLRHCLDLWRPAAVMLEPCLLEAPEEGYLQNLVRLCWDYGTLSIFDESVTGFRWARAGGQEYFKVTPDLAVFGKGLANGMPLACVVGPEAFMRYADVISGTFGGEALSLAAARTVLRTYADPIEAPIQRQWESGQWFLEACKSLQIPVTGYAVHPRIEYDRPTMALFLQETARRGLLLHPGGFNVSAALREQDLGTTYAALSGALDAMCDGVPLEGALPTEAFR